MSQITVTFEPDKKSVQVHPGITLLEAAGRAGIILNTPCGGAGTCRKCAVFIEPEHRSVLACQEKVFGDTTVTVPAEARFYQQQILLHGVEKQVRLSPCVKKIFLPAVPDSVEALLAELKHHNNGSIHDHCPHLDEILESINLQYEKQGISVVLHQVPSGVCPDRDEACYNILCIEPGDSTDSQYGVAVDIGTTTVVAKLIDFADGRVTATSAMANPQIKFGDDVISRIAHSQTSEGYKQLHDTIIGCVNSLLHNLCAQHHVNPRHIYEMTIAGNTTMSHLFLNYPVVQLGQAPYHAYTTQAEDRNARNMGIDINPCGNIHVIENIAGYVGSDTTAAALAVGMDAADKITLLVDIGTNGELVVGTKDKLYSASCAAGPAMEGARISQGSRAVEGAIEKIHIEEDDICIHVIGNAAPRSICGSGIIDAVAVLLDLGIIDETGRFRDRDELEGRVSDAVLNRLTETNGEAAFILAHNHENEGRPVCFTQRDVRESQLSKGALRAGIELLKQKAGIANEDIHQILLAGAFGNYIRRRSAFRIGLLPEVPHEKVIYVGNAASTGAQMVLLSHACREIAARLSQQIEYVEIAHLPEFQMVFAECMMFSAQE